MKLSGKAALVTGSSQGIGRAIALRLAAEGADIIVNYRSHPDGAAAVVKKIEQSDRRAFAVKTDLSDTTAIQRLMDEALAHFGRLDILVNNAGIETRAPFLEVSEEDYDKVLDVNLKSVFLRRRS
jgi:glucose 1-dehydrogenase